MKKKWGIVMNCSESEQNSNERKGIIRFLNNEEKSILAELPTDRIYKDVRREIHQMFRFMLKTVGDKNVPIPELWGYMDYMIVLYNESLDIYREQRKEGKRGELYMASELFLRMSMTTMLANLKGSEICEHWKWLYKMV